MTEEQATQIIALLEDIQNKLSQVVNMGMMHISDPNVQKMGKENLSNDHSFPFQDNPGG